MAGSSLLVIQYCLTFKIISHVLPAVSCAISIGAPEFAPLYKVFSFCDDEYILHGDSSSERKRSMLPASQTAVQASTLSESFSNPSQWMSRRVVPKFTACSTVQTPVSSRCLQGVQMQVMYTILELALGLEHCCSMHGSCSSAVPLTRMQYSSLPGVVTQSQGTSLVCRSCWPLSWW